MIVGTGIDICEVPRIAESIARFGDRFLQRVFTPTEIAYCTAKKNSTERFAARFAAKEAAMKALGTGVARGVSWKDFEVGHAPGGRPILRISGRAAEISKQLRIANISLSLTHTPNSAQAMVIFEAEEK